MIKIALVLSLVTPPLFAAKGTKHQPSAESLVMAPAPTVKDPILEKDYFDKILKLAKEESKRKVANSDTFSAPDAIQEDFRILAKRLNGGDKFQVGHHNLNNSTEDEKVISSPEELDQLIDEVTLNKDKYSHQAQFLVFQLRAMKPFKSIIYRLRQYVGDGKGLKSSIALRSMIVSMIRVGANATEVYFGDSSNSTNPVETSNITSLGENSKNQWQIGFRYFTEPMPGDNGKPVAEITTDLELQKYLSELRNDYATLAVEFQFWVDQNKSIYWDNQVYSNFSNPVSDRDRYTLIGFAEQNTILAGLWGYTSSLCAATAYNLNGLKQAISDTSLMFGVGIADERIKNILGGVDQAEIASGFSSKKKFKILRAQAASGFLQLKNKEVLSLSLVYLRSALARTEVSWNSVKGQQESSLSNGIAANSNFQLFDPRATIPFTRIFNTSFENIHEIIDNNKVTSTVVNGEKITFNFQKFFNGENENLMVFFPTQFDESKKEKTKTVGGKALTYRNYFAENPTFWSYKTYSPYFPDLKKGENESDNTSDVKRVARIMSQSWGAVFFAFPITNLVF